MIGPWLLLLLPMLAETRVAGTLMQPAEPGVATLRLADGSVESFRLDRESRFFMGLKGDLAVDPSLLSPGSSVDAVVESGRLIQLKIQYGWFEVPGQWLDELLLNISEWSRSRWGPDSFFSFQNLLKAVLAVGLVALICGAVSSLVVSNRMAFFSDALAHCAFAGFSLGLILHLFGWFAQDGVLGAMILFGVLVGLAIAYVKEQTTLANDTVIGVFFAGSMGLGAILLSALARIGSRINPENFLFGDPFAVSGQQLVYLLIALLGTLLFLAIRYNDLVLASFNPSLARSRRVRVRLGNYLLIVLLAVVVNLCLNIVGALLINALLILPAATAGNLARSLRSFFWLTLGFSLVFGLGGFVISVSWQPTLAGQAIPLASGGVIVLLGVVLFFLSILVGRWVRGPRALARSAA